MRTNDIIKHFGTKPLSPKEEIALYLDKSNDFRGNQNKLGKVFLFFTSVSEILHKNYETASPSPSISVGWCDYGVIGGQFS